MKTFVTAALLLTLATTARAQVSAGEQNPEPNQPFAIARLLEGEKIAPLCTEFGISRKTGDKIFDRYKVS